MDEPTKSAQGGASRARTVAYWSFTLIVAYEMMAGSMWDLLQIEYLRVVTVHLGYPLYLLLVLGVWKLPCAVVPMLALGSETKKIGLDPNGRNKA